MEDDDEARSRSQSTSQSQTDSQTPPPSPHRTSVSIAVTPGSGHHRLPDDAGGVVGVGEPVTVAASPQRALALALPVQQPRSSGKDLGGGGGGREDCWSEGATSTLIDAWGERYLELKRGNLKQKHWQEVADAVTSRDGYTKPPKTDIQCKNRIDTLKKKYKTEKSKISAGGAVASSWPFFHRLHLLLGPNHKPSSVPRPQPPPPPAQPNSHQKILAGVPIRPPSTQVRSQFPQRNRTSNHPAFKKIRSSTPSASSKSEDGASSADSSDGLPPPAVCANGKRRQQQKQKQPQQPQRGTQEVDEGRTVGLRELTEAILRFGEAYERVESSKLQQAAEMEKQRMAFARELEVQRMQFFMKTQVELSHLKSSSPHRGGSKKRRRLGDVGGSSNYNNGNNNNNSNNGHKNE